ncbi:hypothetical protein [Elizabethkingia meningoseptica]|uniref:hypothetical protein n=1 Tax=Elizabethkingia meningoseptica TaxID=238 RepID=UPI002DD6AE19|nr:hypothetical protein [Elizabethkingia meningoseptica]MEC4712951.1 hypothetical protein [Elizabethkingia meningoseptica]
MKRITSIIGIGALLMASSCSSPKQSVTDKNADQKNVKIEFTGADTFAVKNAKLKVSLYGVSANIADVPATLITEKEYEQKAVPFTIDLPVPANPESLIKPAITKGEAVKYYVAINWDSDGNGKEEKGDIVIDYDKKFPTITIDGNTQQVYLKVSK